MSNTDNGPSIPLSALADVLEGRDRGFVAAAEPWESYRRQLLGLVDRAAHLARRYELRDLGAEVQTVIEAISQGKLDGEAVRTLIRVRRRLGEWGEPFRKADKSAELMQRLEDKAKGI